MISPDKDTRCFFPWWFSKQTFSRTDFQSVACFTKTYFCKQSTQEGILVNRCYLHYKHNNKQNMIEFSSLFVSLIDTICLKSQMLERRDSVILRFQWPILPYRRRRLWFSFRVKGFFVVATASIV